MSAEPRTSVARIGFFRAYGIYLRCHKKYYVIPLLVLLFALVAVLVYFRRTSDTPFVYTPF